VIEGINTEVLVAGLEGPRGMPIVTAAMQSAGIAERTIRKVVGDNLVRLICEAVR
jgi:membrane dipeptidase